ncbi:LysR substrate-binding domain-containing protein [Luteibacter sp. 3190]|uniref:LysR family transcriptional regulator n=1 Tax=Luteibacter sp. 3190 TaxID=2817736 RepID=UPI00285586CC|nr:LysR substrate-binding domain-containing protein [Luteibacter sp. 3190]MDR6937952.1 LysR family transcriptional regulator for bpeEF and oprC [Luteibacter sp. 3190]
MDRLQAMETFIRVIEAGSFRRAAETMHVLPSTVTRTIKELEAHLGARLLNRTTRSLSLTDAGLRYFDSCKAILHDVRAAEATAQQTGAPRGSITIGTTPSLATHFIIPALGGFHARYPGIDLDLHLADATVDVIQRGIDCVIRAGELRPSRLVARRLGAFRWYVCGSPAYFERHGMPDSIEAMGRHTAVGYVNSQTGRSIAWPFRQGTETVSIAMKERVRVNDTDAYVAAGMAGLGLIRVASYMVREPLAEGRLIRVLADVDAPLEPVSALYPQSRHLAPAVRAFIDWAVELFADAARHW